MFTHYSLYLFFCGSSQGDRILHPFLLSDICALIRLVMLVLKPTTPKSQRLSRLCVSYIHQYATRCYPL